MALTIPDHLSAIRSYIEKRYKADEIFRDIYNDYLTYLDAHRFWCHNSMDVASARRSEYAQLASELEKEVIQMLKNGKDKIPVIVKDGKIYKNAQRENRNHKFIKEKNNE
jgi:hypothetical protein